jgi:hypothetical protein
LLRPDISGGVECGPDKSGSDEPTDPIESRVIESSGGGSDRIESNSGGPDIIGSGPDRTGSDLIWEEVYDMITMAPTKA